MVFIESEQESALRTVASASSSNGSLICFSLDGMTAFCRKFGYELADQVTNHVLKVTREVLEPTELIQTPESHVVCYRACSVEEATDRTERLRQRIGSSKLRFTVGARQIAHTVTISAGVAATTASSDWRSSLFEVSQAWFEARQMGNSVLPYRNAEESTSQGRTKDTLAAAEGAIAGCGPDRPVSILMLDVDGLEGYNQASGRAAGDKLLDELITDLHAEFESDGVLGRLWSDEFLVVLPGVRTEDAAFRGEAFRRNIAEKYSAGLSIGVASIPSHAMDTQDLLRRAREARFRSREQGGGRTTVAETDQMVTKTSHFSKIQLKRLAGLARRQARSEAAILREGLDAVLQVQEDGAPSSRALRAR